MAGYIYDDDERFLLTRLQMSRAVHVTGARIGVMRSLAARGYAKVVKDEAGECVAEPLPMARQVDVMARKPETSRGPQDIA